MGLFYTYNTSVDKAYIIRIKNHELSENLAKRCSDSCEKVGMPYEFWDAYNGLGEEIFIVKKKIGCIELLLAFRI